MGCFIIHDIVRQYYNIIMYYNLISAFIAMSAYSKASRCDQRHAILLLCINTCGIICTVRHFELEDCACVMTVVQTDNYIKKFIVRSTLFIFNGRSKIYNQSWSHKSVRMVSAFKVYTRIILLDHNFHCNTTLQLFSWPLLFVCYKNNSFQFWHFPPLILVTLNCFQILNFKTQ